MKTIGIDIGTTTISGVVLDLNNGKILYKQTIESKSNTSQEGVQDVNVIIEKATHLLHQCLKQSSDIQAIGLTGQMHGIVYVDGFGKAISPLYTWQDPSGQALVDEINQHTSHPVAAGYGLVTHVYHVRENQVPSQAKSLCTIMDYFGMYLTQTTNPLMHTSNAASLGFWHTEKGIFEEDALQNLGINPTILPSVTEEIQVIGNYKNIPVLVAIGDNQASFLGTVGNKVGTVLVNMGTGGQVSLLSNRYVRIQGVETRPFIDGKYLLVGASLCGGRAYAILEKFLRNYVKAATGIDESQYGTMERLASQYQKADPSLEVCTTFKGTRTNPNQLGSILNISEQNFLPKQLIYGFMSGMIDELYALYLRMKEVTVDETRALMASGNGMRKNSILQAICERTFDLPLMMAKYEEEAACGAALCYMEVR